MNHSIQIEKGVPVSDYYLARSKKYVARGNNSSRRDKVKNGRGNRNCYPFATMEVGDSFLLPIKKVQNSARIGNQNLRSTTNYPYEMRSIAKAYGAALDREFIVLRDDNHQWRCYRLK